MCEAGPTCKLPSDHPHGTQIFNGINVCLVSQIVSSFHVSQPNVLRIYNFPLCVPYAQPISPCIDLIIIITGEWYRLCTEASFSVVFSVRWFLPRKSTLPLSTPLPYALSWGETPYEASGKITMLYISYEAKEVTMVPQCWAQTALCTVHVTESRDEKHDRVHKFLTHCYSLQYNVSEINAHDFSCPLSRM